MISLSLSQLISPSLPYIRSVATSPPPASTPSKSPKSPAPKPSNVQAALAAKPPAAATASTPNLSTKNSTRHPNLKFCG
jgi:hypothetical protein